MIYVYDMAMNGKRVASFKRYGVRYKLEKKFMMGDREFYSYVCPGREKILVVPGFAEQYREAEAKLAKYNGERTYEAYRKWVAKNINHTYSEEDFPTLESATGVMKVIGAEYLDIHVTFEYLNGKLRIGDEFEIRDHNIFGNGIVVQMNIDMKN